MSVVSCNQPIEREIPKIDTSGIDNTIEILVEAQVTKAYILGKLHQRKLDEGEFNEVYLNSVSQNCKSIDITYVDWKDINYERNHEL